MLFIIYKKSKNKLICKIAKYTAYNNKQKFNNYKKIYTNKVKSSDRIDIHKLKKIIKKIREKITIIISNIIN